MVDWLALVIGNTRWHWAWFQDNTLKHVWHNEHLANSTTLDAGLRSIWSEHAPSQILHLPVEAIEIWAVSVVPNQTHYLAPLSNVRWIKHFPIKNVYATMGLDRVTTLYGAGQRYGWPILVIDSGTALTFTAGAAGAFMGGAILLGVRSHLAALHDYTAALPKINLPSTLPPIWAHNTTTAIQSGVLHTILTSIHQFISKWRNQYPDASILFTGGDGEYLYDLYTQQQKQQNQALDNRTWFDPNLMFWGITTYRNDATRAL